MALEGGEGSASRTGRSLPPGKTRYGLHRWLGGPQGRSGQVRKISPRTGIRSPDRPARSQSLYRLSYPAPSDNIRQFQRAVETFFIPLKLCSLRNLMTVDGLLEGSRGDQRKVGQTFLRSSEQRTYRIQTGHAIYVTQFSKFNIGPANAAG